MMKKTNVGPLLLLLLLDVTSRNSCASPIASLDGTIDGVPAHSSCTTVNGTTEGAPANMSSTIANYIMEGADILTVAMTWLKDSKPRSSHFDKSINDLIDLMLTLPEKVVEQKYNIYYGLYRSEDRFKELNTVLKVAATNLIRYCNSIIQTFYGHNGCSKEFLKFIAVEFGEFARSVSRILKIALNITKEIEDILSDSEAFIIDVKAKQEYGKKDIEVEQETARDIQVMESNLENQKQKFIIMLNKDEQYTVYFDGKQQIRIVKQSELLNKMKLVFNSTTTLLSHVEDVKVYLEMEICLITEWHERLNATITPEYIHCNTKGIKESINVLIKAGDDYLAHELADILKSRESLITSGN